jgi:hypothetical protein
VYHGTCEVAVENCADVNKVKDDAEGKKTGHGARTCFHDFEMLYNVNSMNIVALNGTAAMT